MALTAFVQGRKFTGAAIMLFLSALAVTMANAYRSWSAGDSSSLRLKVSGILIRTKSLKT